MNYNTSIMKSIKILIIVVLLLFSTVFVKGSNDDSVFFTSLNLRYKNPDKGIALANSLLDTDKTKAFIALGYNYYFKSDYDSATDYFDSIMHRPSINDVVYYLALTGKGLIEQRYGYYDKSYENLMKVNEFFNNEKPTQKNKTLFLTANAINLIGLAALEYYYTNSYERINAKLDKIEKLIFNNENQFSNEMKSYLYYFYAENYLSNNENKDLKDTLSYYFGKCFKYSDSSQNYLLGNLFELIGKYKLKKEFFDFLDTNNNLSSSLNNFVKITIQNIYRDENEIALKALNKSLHFFKLHSDPYQISSSNFLITKHYFKVISDSLINNPNGNICCKDSIEKYLYQTKTNYHKRYPEYFNQIFQGFNIDSINDSVFISRLVSLDWYLEYLKQINEYYGLMNNKPNTLKKEYLFNIKLIELLEKEKQNATNVFFQKMEDADKKTIEAENDKYLIIIFAIAFILVFSIVFSIYIVWKKRKLQKNFNNKNEELEKKNIELDEKNKQLIESKEKQAKLDTMDKLIGWFAHETKTPLEIAVTGLTTNKKLLGKFTNSNSIYQNSKEFYRLQRIDENSNIILDNIKQTNRVVKQLRVISLKQLENDLRVINLHEFLLNVFVKLKYHREDKVINLFLTGDVYVSIKTYPVALDQVFSNLIINSIIHGFKNRRKGEIAINVKQRQNSLEIEYSDNGNGINKEVQGKIFKEFYSSIKGGGGTGLGMSITKTLIERDFLGTIRLKESIPNKQTTFSFNLKRFDDDKQSDKDS